MAASKIQDPALIAADRTYILSALSGFSGKTVENWLPPNHPAKHGELPDEWNLVKILPSYQLVEAVAAAAPNHCVDGWSYASRALSALLSGDAHAARHLSYYAQLRAGLSILANIGIGIFNGINFSIDQNGNIIPLDIEPQKPKKRGAGTHDIVWDALQAWSGNVQKSKVFLDLIKIRNTSLKDCIDAIWPGFIASSATSNLIEAWGIDLRRGKNEHKFRKTSSYIPQAFNNVDENVNDVFQFVEDFWKLFEPAGGSFDYLDRFLLRSLLQGQHVIVTGDTDYRLGSIEHRHQYLPSNIKNMANKDFLLGMAEPNNPYLVQCALSITDPAQPIEMLSRAFLLLRVATAFTRTSFTQAGINCSGSDLRPWLDKFVFSRGFWSPNVPLNELIDLWGDVEIALDYVKNAGGQPPTSLYNWLNAENSGIPFIHQAERVIFWNLCA